MGGSTQTISAHLQLVDEIRRESNADPRLARRMMAIKQFQHARFHRDYAGLLSSPRYASAAGFFLDDLYGQADFAARDAQFGRVVPTMARLLPAEVMHTVSQMAELHALSESLDQQMAQALTSDDVNDGSYRAAWQAVGRPDDRARQLDLLIAVGTSLDQHTRTPLLSTSLRLMRGPAKVAGLSQLQSFLERGLIAFKAMGGAGDFLSQIAANERRVIDGLFSCPKR
jgi:hypothetical protein